MPYRIAHRINGRTTVQCGEGGENYFALHSFFDYTYLDDEKALVLQPSNNGKGAFCDLPGRTYGRSDMTRAISFNCLPDWLPAFQVNEAVWDVIDDMMIWRRPPVWSLPWTKAAPGKDARAVAEYGLDVRLASAKRNMVPLKQVISLVPAWPRKALGTDPWCEVVQKHAPRLNADPVDTRV